MLYNVSATDLSNIRLNEPDEVKEILRNVAVVIATRRGSVPMNRNFGLDQSFLDKPMELAKVMAIAPVREAIEEFEPRAEFIGITMEPDPSEPGCMTFTVQIEIKGEQEE